MMGAFEQLTVDVTTDLAAAMRRSVEDGAYESTDQIIDDALRDWARSQQMGNREVEWLREAIAEGERGPAIPAEDVFAEARAVIRRQ